MPSNFDAQTQFKPSAKPTIGVEWELAFLDPATRDLAHEAPKIMAEVTKRNPEVHVEPEFLRNTIELVTGICNNVGEAVAELAHDLEAIREVAEEEGLKIWGAGSHPFSDFRSSPVSDKGHYKEIIERTQCWGSQMFIWGIHVHVGLKHRDRVWPIINALTTYYPHMLALTASSPGWDGLDTGYASNRTMLYQQLPTAGLPPQFETWEEWTDYMRDQERSGVISHTGSMHLDIRPSAALGTVEVRIADSASNLRELSAVVALTHCLVVYLDRKIDAGEKLTWLQPWHVAENKWRAARYGLEAQVIVDRDTREVWLRDDLPRLIEELTPVAQDLDCVRELGLIHEILNRGAGYQRQREIFEETGSWEPAIDTTLAEMDLLEPLD